ncbi:MAG TPA: phosphatase PAP2 family protein [Candidatus Saccharimonadales bacterium]
MNDDIFLFINHLAGHSSVLDSIMVFLAKDMIYIIGAVAVACVGLLVYRRQWRPIIFFCVSMAISFILLKLLGMLNVDHRPFMDHKVLMLIEHAPGKSFPSDHTTASAAMAAGILFITKFKKIGALLLVAAVLVGFSRIFVGVHYPADILGGLVAGVGGAVLGYAVMARLGGKSHKRVSFDSH